MCRSNIVRVAWIAAFLFTSSNSFAGISNQYLVKFRVGLATADVLTLLSDSGLKMTREFPQISWIVAESKLPLSDVQINAIKQRPQILHFEKNQIWKAIAAPTDPRYSEQNNMARLNLEQAWDLATGSSSVVVAVSDTGISKGHPDLKNRIWSNPNEIPGNGVDDDGNGFVDDTWGWNFAGSNNNPDDENSHGTHCSGIIGAEANNGEGISGVNWDVRFMAVQFLTKEGSGSSDDGIGTILYAADNGAQVLSMSWGGGGFTQALEDALNYAAEKGVLLVAAAGNDSADGDTEPHFPSAYDVPGLVAVASSAGVGQLSSFSNYGLTTVDLAAPGSSILSSILDGNYKRYSGTSMATPMVAGVAALVLSKYPNTDVNTLRNALFNAIDERTAYDGKIATSGDLNAYKALKQFDEGFQVWPSKLTIGQEREHQFTAFGAQGNVVWSVSDTSIATVSSDGTVTGKELGNVDVSATDATGTTVSTTWVRIVEASSEPGGCFGLGLPIGGKATSVDTVNALCSFALPLVFGFAYSRRRRKKRA